MTSELKPYIPDLERIAENSKNPEPVIVTKEEFEEVMAQPEIYGLYRGADMSDEEILRAMELGWIKIGAPDGGFNIIDQIQPASVDLRLGQNFWHYGQNAISRLTIGEHLAPLRDLELLHYTYKIPGEEFVFFPSTIVLATTQEWVSLSNALHGKFDGRSLAARLGLSSHQTAGHFEPGFVGAIMMEISNVNILHIGLRANERIGSMTFSMFGSPSTRPRTHKLDRNVVQEQVSPFGFWDPGWDEVKRKRIEELSREATKGFLNSFSQEERYNRIYRAFE